MYCTLYHRHRYIVHIVHVPCFPVSDVEVSSSTSVHHTCSHLYKFTLSHSHSVALHLTKLSHTRLVVSVCDIPSFELATISIFGLYHFDFQHSIGVGNFDLSVTTFRTTEEKRDYHAGRGPKKQYP